MRDVTVQFSEECVWYVPFGFAAYASHRTLEASEASLVPLDPRDRVVRLVLVAVGRRMKDGQAYRDDIHRTLQSILTMKILLIYRQTKNFHSNRRLLSLQTSFFQSVKHATTEKTLVDIRSLVFADSKNFEAREGAPRAQ